MNEDNVLLLGAVAYDPKVVTIWEGFKAYFARHGLLMDYILYSNYERQVEALLDGHIHVAWNSPLAWVRACRLAHAHGEKVQAIAMRDTDRDLTSVVVVLEDSPIKTVTNLKDWAVAVGAIDSPQATLLPLAHLHTQGLDPDRDFVIQYNNVLVGKHGDHIGGERNAALKLITGEANAACMLEANYALFISEGTLPPGTTRILTRTVPFDHCNFTISSTSPQPLVDRFRSLLTGMSYDDPDVRPLCDLEGLKAWYEGRLQGYQALEAAVDDAHFYDQHGNITAEEYQY
jgi:ABC-type phosphate/phosphonate transport system substrate-binding protein